ncbi:MAG: hypothetical protein IPL40_12785 [Proteobacteria bacterium]|nr:hypothetical protein [Pseudomonadota bacterium]
MPTAATQPALCKRPMAVVRQVSLFAREVIERLSTTGTELLLADLSRLSEGQRVDGRYFGSTMLTLDLRRLEGRMRDSGDVGTALRLARQWATSELVIGRLRTLALAEAERIAGQPLQADGIDVRVRAEGSWLFVDIDLEAEADEDAQRVADCAHG